MAIPVHVNINDIKIQYMINAKVMDCLSREQDLREQMLFEIVVMPRTKRRDKEVIINVALEIDDDLGSETCRITPFDRAVMDACYTLYVNNCREFTPAMISALVSGNTAKRPSSQKTAQVAASIDMLRHIYIRLDCTDEFRIRKLITADEYRNYNGYMLPVDDIDVEPLNHKGTVRGYQLYEEPVIYAYAGMIRQIINVPVALLKTPLQETEDVTIIKRYLLLRIEQMRNKRNKIRSTRICFSRYDRHDHAYKGLYHVLGYQPGQYSVWANKRIKINRTVFRILDYYVSSGYIASYEIVRTGQAQGATAVDIII